MESDRADARLTRAECKPFFFEVVRPVYNEFGFDKSRIYNFDESGFFRQFITSSGARKVNTKRGCNDVYRRRGYGCEHMTGIACIRADGIGTVPLTLTSKTKKVKGVWFQHASTPVVLLGNGTGWITAADFQVNLERVFQHYTGRADMEDVRIFAPLKRKIRRGQDCWLRSHQGRSLTHSRFVELVTSAWGSVAGTTQVKESFCVTGLFPLSFDEFMEHAPVPRNQR